MAKGDEDFDRGVKTLQTTSFPLYTFHFLQNQSNYVEYKSVPCVTDILEGEIWKVCGGDAWREIGDVSDQPDPMAVNLNHLFCLFKEEKIKIYITLEG